MSHPTNPKVRSTKAQRWFNADGLLIGTRGRLYELDDRGRVVATFHEGEYSLCPGADLMYGVEPCGSPAPLGGICPDCIRAMLDEDAHRGVVAAERAAERAREDASWIVIAGENRGMVVEDEDGNLC